jgi:hypothetical protein
MWPKPRSKYAEAETEPSAAFFDVFPLRDFRPFRWTWERAMDVLSSISGIEYQELQIRVDSQPICNQEPYGFANNGLDVKGLELINSI